LQSGLAGRTERIWLIQLDGPTINDVPVSMIAFIFGTLNDFEPTATPPKATT